MSGIDLTFPGPVPSRGDHRRRKIGLLGGSFNPAHDGHRHISLEAIRRLGLDEVWWLVSPQNPLKPRAGMLPLPIRIEKARHMARHPRIRVSGLESHLPSRFTADTLRALKTRFPAAQFVWLMGADNMLQIPHWYRWSTIFSLVPVAILDRGEYAGRALVGTAAQRFLRFRVAASQVSDLAGKTPPAWAFLRIRLHPASSTAIRSQRREPEERT